MFNYCQVTTLPTVHKGLGEISLHSYFHLHCMSISVMDPRLPLHSPDSPPSVSEPWWNATSLSRRPSTVPSAACGPTTLPCSTWGPSWSTSPSTRPRCTAWWSAAPTSSPNRSPTSSASQLTCESLQNHRIANPGIYSPQALLNHPIISKGYGWHEMLRSNILILCNSYGCFQVQTSRQIQTCLFWGF